MTEATDRRGGPAARGVRLPRDARRAVLLDAAQDVFVANGYHSAAMDEIADRAGVSKPVLYQHFPGKLDLYLALVTTHVDVLVAGVVESIASTTDNRYRIAAAVGAYFDFVDREDQAFRLVFESDLRNEPAVQEAVERAEQACADAIAAVVIEDAGLDANHATLIAVGIVGLCQTAARYWLRTERAVPKAEAIDRLSRFAWKGFAGLPLTHP
ncbi:MAG TPA: TetR/AcrR family transcriptional regulator [Pseudonocardiaceae bacterium]